MKINTLVPVMVAIGFTLTTFTAQAVPSFARDTAKNCSYCHNAWPQLSKKGRLYKELGYRLPDGERLAFKEMVEEDKHVPVSAVLVARPYDKKDSSGDANMRALHEVEVIVAGRVGKSWSGFFEIEAEDEAQGEFGFEVGIPAAVLSYNHSKAVNVQLNWGEALWADP